MRTRCLNCFAEYDDKFGLCPNCGETEVDATNSIDLVPGTILAERYLLGRSISSTEVFILYKAFDLKHEKVVAIKEFFPPRLVSRAYGQKSLLINGRSRDEFEYRKSRFISEARSMSRFGAHRNLAGVKEFFEEGVLVRGGTEWGYPTFLRITFGTPEENEIALSLLERSITKRRAR